MIITIIVSFAKRVLECLTVAYQWLVMMMEINSQVRKVSLLHIYIEDRQVKEFKVDFLAFQFLHRRHQLTQNKLSDLYNLLLFGLFYAPLVYGVCYEWFGKCVSEDRKFYWNWINLNRFKHICKYVSIEPQHEFS